MTIIMYVFVCVCVRQILMSVWIQEAVTRLRLVLILTAATSAFVLMVTRDGTAPVQVTTTTTTTTTHCWVIKLSNYYIRLPIN